MRPKVRIRLVCEANKEGEPTLQSKTVLTITPSLLKGNSHDNTDFNGEVFSETRGIKRIFSPTVYYHRLATPHQRRRLQGARHHHCSMTPA